MDGRTRRGTSLRNVGRFLELTEGRCDNWQLCGLEQPRQEVHTRRSHGGVLDKSQDKAVREFPCFTAMRVVVAWPRGLKEMMDSMRTGYGEKSAERQYGAEGIERSMRSSVLKRAWQEGRHAVWA